jgi:SAM-dependent methyltransferase
LGAKARRWLRSAARRTDTVPIVREALLPAVFAVFYWVVGGLLHFRGQGLGAEIFGTLVAAAIGYYVAYRIRIRGFIKSVKLIRQVADQSTFSAGRHLFVEMIHDRMTVASGIVDGFQHDTYASESPEQLQGWIDTFFRLGGGTYIGVDSNKPSQYWSDYSWFLDAHAKSLAQRRQAGQPVDDVRILALPKTDLDDDFFGIGTFPDYERFVAWHTDHEVELRTISPVQLAEIRRDLDLAITDDVALWLKFAALFTGPQVRDGDEVAIKLRITGDSDTAPNYVKLNTFMTAVRKQSTLIGEDPPTVEMGDATLIEHWNDYIAPEVRWLDGGAYERFMTDNIPKDASVFDAAAGTGVDSVNLLSRGYSVVSNEVDPRFTQSAKQFGRRRGVPLELRNARWEQLRLAGNPKFDIVLVLGNSLCLVESEDRRRSALKAFWEILRPAGRLIIDERNFEYMRRNRDAILADPLANWLNHVKDVMYPGRGLLAFPSEISDARVVWSFVKNEPAVTTAAEVWERAKEFHPLDLYAFGFGELYKELEKAGFVVQSVSGDLDQLASGSDVRMPSYEATADRGILTYVAARP